MVAAIKQVDPLSRRLTRGAMTLLVASVAALGTAGAAFAQAPGGPPPSAPPVPVAGSASLSVDIELDDDEAESDASFDFQVTVSNDGPGVATGALLYLTVDEEFDIESVTDAGPKELIDSGDETRVYRLGDLQPGQEIEFSVHGEFDDTDRSDVGDEFDFTAEVRSAAGEEDAEDEVELERDNGNNGRNGNN